MDEARQRAEWQRTASLVCMVYNTTCDTRKSGKLTPDMVHPLAGVERQAGAEAESANPDGGRFSPQDARQIESVFGDRKTVYKV